MPSFQKIGGLLTNGTDADALHTAVIAINEAVAENVYFLTPVRLFMPIIITIDSLSE